MHGLTHATLYSSDEAINNLATSDDSAFWSFAQEFVAITRARLAGASPEAIARLIERVTTEGPLRYVAQQGEQGDIDWPARARDREMWLRLTVIGEQTPLPDAAAALLEDIRVRREYLARQIDDRDQFRGWSSGVRAVRGKTARLLSAQPSERLAIADELEISRDIEDREGWPEYCREDPTGALAALRARPLDLALAPRWKTWLQILPFRRDDASEETLTAIRSPPDMGNRRRIDRLQPYASSRSPPSSVGGVPRS